jgi:hypothetical protein
MKMSHVLTQADTKQTYRKCHWKICSSKKTKENNKVNNINNKGAEK